MSKNVAGADLMEITEIAMKAWHRAPGNAWDAMLAAIEAIVPRLVAEGQREVTDSARQWNAYAIFFGDVLQCRYS